MTSPSGRHGETPRRPERLGLPHVPDPGDEPLVEQRLAEPPRRCCAAESRDHRVEVGRPARMSGPSRRTARWRSSSTGPFDLSRLERAPAEDEPRPPEDAATPRGRTRQRPRHAQVAAQHDAALEAQQQVLADRLDATRAAGRRARSATPLSAAARGCGDSACTRSPDERLEPAGRAVQRVALGHAASVAPCTRLPACFRQPVSARRAEHRGRRSPHRRRRADTLRKWEQRYGVLRPTRTAGGQRRYAEDDVARVEWLAAPARRGLPDRRGGGAARRRPAARPRRPRSCATRCSPPRPRTRRDGARAAARPGVRAPTRSRRRSADVIAPVPRAGRRRLGARRADASRQEHLTQRRGPRPARAPARGAARRRARASPCSPARPESGTSSGC